MAQLKNLLVSGPSKFLGPIMGKLVGGATFTQPVNFVDDNALPSKNLEFILGIDSFGNGGQVGWQNLSQVTVGNASNASQVPWGGVTNKPATFPPETHNHDTLYLKRAGDTLSSPLTVTGGDAANKGKIILDQANQGQITDTGTATLFGFTSSNALTIGSTSYTTNIRGSSVSINGKEVALKSDIPTIPDIGASGSGPLTLSATGHTLTGSIATGTTNAVGVVKQHTSSDCTSYTSDEGATTPLAVNKAVHKLALTGDVTGSFASNATGQWIMTTTVGDNSHNHTYTTIPKYPYGFQSNGGNISWGTLAGDTTTTTGYRTIARWDSPNGGSVAFADGPMNDNTYKGQTSMQIDGYFYQNEGQYRVIDTNTGDGRYLKLSGGTMTGPITYSTDNSTYNSNATNHYISAGAGYSVGSGRYGLKLLCCDQSDVQTGLGMDLTGFSYETCLATSRGADTTPSYITFATHTTKTTAYKQLGYFEASGATNPAVTFRVNGQVNANTLSISNGATINGNATINNLLTVKSESSHCGIKAGNTYIASIGGQLIFQNNDAIRFGGDSWDYNVWAGLKYVPSEKSVYLGLADGGAFTTNAAQTGGNLVLPGISNIGFGGVGTMSSQPIKMQYNSSTKSLDFVFA